VKLYGYRPTFMSGARAWAAAYAVRQLCLWRHHGWGGICV